MEDQARRWKISVLAALGIVNQMLDIGGNNFMHESMCPLSTMCIFLLSILDLCHENTAQK